MQVFEGEAPAPHPAHVLVMVQINPLAAEGPDAPVLIKQQLHALEKALKQAATAQGLALTSLAVQVRRAVYVVPGLLVFGFSGLLGLVCGVLAWMVGVRWCVLKGSGGDRMACPWVVVMHENGFTLWRESTLKQAAVAQGFALTSLVVQLSTA